MAIDIDHLIEITKYLRREIGKRAGTGGRPKIRIGLVDNDFREIMKIAGEHGIRAYRPNPDRDDLFHVKLDDVEFYPDPRLS
jgi:hypothetical protein